MGKKNKKWIPGSAPVSVIMITLNEGHNLKGILENLSGWAENVFILDSYSKDNTIDIAISYGVEVYQRKFTNFGDQWNFALENLPIKSDWTMKIDPDERLTDELKANLKKSMFNSHSVGLCIDRHLLFMQKRLPVKDRLTRVWRSGTCRFTNVDVNEYPIISGSVEFVSGKLHHLDSPNLDHWLNKQNKYTTAEAIIRFQKKNFAVKPKLYGDRLQRRIFLKKHFYIIPGRYLLLFLYLYFIRGAWRAGLTGYRWTKLRVFVMRITEYKFIEMINSVREPSETITGTGEPDQRAKQI